MSRPAMREFKSFALKLDAPPDDEGRFTGYAAVFNNVDKGNDVIEPGAFTKTLQENPQVPILWAHDTDEPIGVSTMLAQDSKGLKFEGQLAMDVQRAREVHSLMKIGAIKGVSIGYNTIKRAFQGTVRRLQEVALAEFSPVVFPMNPLAGVDAVKTDRKYYGLYSEATEGVGALLQMIACGTDFLADEVAEGDTDDASRMQGILTSLTKLLASELGQVASGEEGDDDPEVVYVEAMSQILDPAIKKLEALRAYEPASATRKDDGAAFDDDDEPDLASTLAALSASLRRA